MTHCPHCGSPEVCDIGPADNKECQSCGWLADDGLGGGDADWDGYRKAREEAKPKESA